MKNGEGSSADWLQYPIRKGVLWYWGALKYYESEQGQGGPRSAARFKQKCTPEVKPGSKLTKCPEQDQQNN